MNVTKRILCLVLVLCMLALALASCAEQTSPTDTDTPPSATTPPTTTPQASCVDGHTPCAWTVDTPATLDTAGKRQSVCAVCGTLLSSTATETLSPERFDNITFSQEVTTLDLIGYTLVYPNQSADGNAFTTTFTNTLSALAQKLTAVGGKTFTAYREQIKPSNTAGREILVGKTSDAASTWALSQFTGHGYGVFLYGEKIVVIGTTDLLTLRAVELFVQKYLAAGSKEITLHHRACSAPVEMVTLADAEQIFYTIVRSADLDENPGVEYGATYGKDFVDYPVNAVKSLQEKLAALVGLTLTKDAWAKDSAARTDLELMVGCTNRADSAEALARLGGHEYGIFVSGEGRIVLTAWNDTNLQYCVSRFTDLLTESRVKVNGEWRVMMPTDFSDIGASDVRWVDDIPMPSKSVLTGTVDVQNGSLAYVFTGADMNGAVYLGYCEILKQNGYTVLQESGNVEESYFTTMINEQKNRYVYLALNAFAHADEFSGALAYANSDPCIRIVCSTLDNVNLPSEEMLQFTPFVQSKNPATSLSAIGMSHAGAGYIMRLEDGSFIVMDGGTTDQGTEVDNVWNMLCQMHAEAHGAAPSEENPVRIAAWIISHNHGDHYGIFNALCKKYGKTGLLQLDYLLGNFPAAATYYNTPESSNYIYQYMNRFQGYFTKPFTFIQVHTGQRLWFANVEVEILFTHEDFYPHPIVAFNDSSTIVRLNAITTNGDKRVFGSSKTSFVFTGDLYRYGSLWLCAMYGNYLKSNMVSLAHHGGPGAAGIFYSMVNATALWVPNSTAALNGYVGSQSGTGSDDRMAANNKNTQYIFCANYRDGSYRNLTVTFGLFSPLYDDATNPGGEGKIVYGTIVSGSGSIKDKEADCGKRK